MVVKYVRCPYPQVSITAIIFVVALLARGSAIFPGYSIDDYPTVARLDPAQILTYASQGRFFISALKWICGTLEINFRDMYFAFGLSAIFLQACFIATILKFFGTFKKVLMPGIIGALIISHPYFAEILTFRMALIPYCAAILFSIFALELICLDNGRPRSKILAFICICLMLATYQIFISYFFVVVIFGFIVKIVSKGKCCANSVVPTTLATRTKYLFVLTVSASLIYFLVIYVIKFALKIAPTGRGTLVEYENIFNRVHQISNALVNIYWLSDPVLPGVVKKILAFGLFISLMYIFLKVSLRKERSVKERTTDSFELLFCYFMLLPASLGVLVFLNDWWPIARVLGQVPVIIGLTFFVPFLEDDSNSFLSPLFKTSMCILTVVFVCLNNQILADQQQVNMRDRMLANRIIYRLESLPGFRGVRFVHIVGKAGYQKRLSTTFGDMNVSAFTVRYSQIPLLSDVSGYKFEEAIGEKSNAADYYCAKHHSWPEAESVAIEGDVGIICLGKY